MNLNAASTLAIQLMTEHGLIGKGWKFQFDRAVKRFGLCNHTGRVISLSKPLTLACDKDNVKDTILHEIAHALVGVGHGHDYVWQQMCRKIGAIPKRCGTISSDKEPKLKYYAVCGACKKEYQRAKRPRNNVRIACRCQKNLSWDDKILLEYKQRY